MKENGKTNLSAKVKKMALGEQILVRRDEFKPSVARTIIYHVGQDEGMKFETKFIDDILVVTRTA